MRGLWNKFLAENARWRATVLGRLQWWSQMFSGVTMVAFFTCMFLRDFPPKSSFDTLWLPLLFLGVQIVILAASRTRIRTVRRRAGACGWKMCDRCGYDLQMTPEPGPCPECGSRFAFKDLENYWMRTWNR